VEPWVRWGKTSQKRKKREPTERTSWQWHKKKVVPTRKSPQSKVGLTAGGQAWVRQRFKNVLTLQGKGKKPKKRGKELAMTGTGRSAGEVVRRPTGSGECSIDHGSRLFIKSLEKGS